MLVILAGFIFRNTYEEDLKSKAGTLFTVASVYGRALGKWPLEGNKSTQAALN